MKRPVLLGLLIAAVAAVIGLIVVMRSALPDPNEVPSAVKDLTITLDGGPVTLKDGISEQPAAPGSAAKNIVRLVGEPVMGDATADGGADAALLIANDPGGSGTFYYAVLAVADGGSYRATNAVPLGDRIKPQGVDFTDGRFVYRFLERKPGEAFTAAPTVEKRVVITVDPASNRIFVG